MADDPGTVLRAGTSNDIPRLAVHHRKMFEEIWKKRGIPADPASMQALEAEYAGKLQAGFRDGSCVAWVICKADRIISSGAVSVCTYVPVPRDPSSVIAFFHSVYTEEDQRGQGFAGLITREAASFCRMNGIRRLYLFASEDGRPVYEMNGFSPVENTMMLFVE